MFKSYRVGTVFGIPIRLDVTFLLILPVFAWLLGGQIGEVVPVLNDAVGTDIDAASLTEGATPWLVGLVAAVALFGCVVLHELGHSLVAMAYGYEMESITLWLLGGIARPAELPTRWTHEFWIAIAGPAVSVGIAIACGLLLVVVPPVDVVVFLLVYLALLNVVLAVFNMLPAFPLDGGRVLRALLARNQTHVRATRQAAAVGKGFAVLLGLVGILVLDFFLMAIALFVYIAATAETRQMMLDAAFEGLSIDVVMTPAGDLETVAADTPITDLLDAMFAARHIGYPVLDGDAFVGLVTLEDVQSAATDGATVADVMTPREDLATIRTDGDVMDAFETLGGNDVGRLPVVDEDGQLAGILTRTDLVRAFQIVTEQERHEDRDVEGVADSRFS